MQCVAQFKVLSAVAVMRQFRLWQVVSKASCSQ